MKFRKIQFFLTFFTISFFGISFGTDKLAFVSSTLIFAAIREISACNSSNPLDPHYPKHIPHTCPLAFALITHISLLQLNKHFSHLGFRYLKLLVFWPLWSLGGPEHLLLLIFSKEWTTAKQKKMCKAPGRGEIVFVLPSSCGIIL
jgi:hypothetical protein